MRYDNGTTVAAHAESARLPADPALGTTFLAFADVNGALRGKQYGDGAFASIQRRGHAVFTDLLLALDPVDEPITTLHEFGIRSGAADLRAVPVVDTLRELPWRRGARMCLADLEWPDGRPCGVAPRTALTNVLDRLASLGLRSLVAFEYEVRLRWASDGRFVTSAQSYSAVGAERICDFVERLAQACDVLELGLIAVHTEGGPGLVEINSEPRTGVRAADDAVLLRHVVREVAQQSGMVASFLAKPVVGEEGSSGHVHVSLWRGAVNAMTGDTPGAPSEVATHAIAGVVEHLPAASLLLNPTINSYKRLVPGFFAPVNATWGYDNRSAAVRAIEMGDPEQARIEVRRPGADANPYLVLTAIVAAIVSGIERGALPPAPAAGDVSGAAPAVAPPLPCSLAEALVDFAADTRFRNLLGDELCSYLQTTRAWELEQWQHAVTQWELDRYGLTA